MLLLTGKCCPGFSSFRLEHLVCTMGRHQEEGHLACSAQEASGCYQGQGAWGVLGNGAGPPSLLTTCILLPCADGDASCGVQRRAVPVFVCYAQQHVPWACWYNSICMLL